MGEFIYLVDINVFCFDINKRAQLIYDNQELARSVLRSQFEEFKRRYTPYAGDKGWRKPIQYPDSITQYDNGGDNYLAFFGSIKELFVHGEGANIIGLSGGVVRSIDYPDIMCRLNNTQVSYNNFAQNSSLSDTINVETQTEVNDFDFSEANLPHGFTAATPEDEKRYSDALCTINKRKIR